MRILDRNIDRGRNKSTKQAMLSTWEKTSFISIGIVQSFSEKTVKVKLIPSITYEDYDMKKGFTDINTVNPVVDCLVVSNLAIIEQDVVLVVFTDKDSRQAIVDIRKGRNRSDNFNTKNTQFHNSNFGIIINKVII